MISFSLFSSFEGTPSSKDVEMSSHTFRFGPSQKLVTYRSSPEKLLVQALSLQEPVSDSTFAGSSPDQVAALCSAAPAVVGRFLGLVESATSSLSLHQSLQLMVISNSFDI